MKLLGNQAIVATAGVNFVRKLYYRHDEMEFGVLLFFTKKKDEMKYLLTYLILSLRFLLSTIQDV